MSDYGAFWIGLFGCISITNVAAYWADAQKAKYAKKRTRK